MKLEGKKLIFFIILIFLFIRFCVIYEQKKKNNKGISKSIIFLRKLWDETIRFDTTYRNNEELESIEHCRDSDYKYFIHYVAGQNYTFNQFINRDNAVKSNFLIYNFINLAATY